MIELFQPFDHPMVFVECGSVVIFSNIHGDQDCWSMQPPHRWLLDDDDGVSDHLISWMDGSDGPVLSSFGLMVSEHDSNSTDLITNSSATVLTWATQMEWPHQGTSYVPTMQGSIISYEWGGWEHWLIGLWCTPLECTEDIVSLLLIMICLLLITTCEH